MEKKRGPVPHYTDVSYSNLTQERARKIFNAQAVFHPERDICCTTIGEDGKLRRMTFNPRFIVRDRKNEYAAVEQMTKAYKVNIVPNPTKHTRR